MENKPLRNLPPVVDTVPGASAIQQLLDRTAWAQQAANPAAYAPLVERPAILQFARGATFFASDGATVNDPDGAGPIFETPMVGPPTEDLAFLP